MVALEPLQPEARKRASERDNWKRSGARPETEPPAPAVPLARSRLRRCAGCEVRTCFARACCSRKLNEHNDHGPHCVVVTHLNSCYRRFLQTLRQQHAAASVNEAVRELRANCNALRNDDAKMIASRGCRLHERNRTTHTRLDAERPARRESEAGRD